MIAIVTDAQMSLQPFSLQLPFEDDRGFVAGRGEREDRDVLPGGREVRLNGLVDRFLSGPSGKIALELASRLYREDKEDLTSLP